MPAVAATVSLAEPVTAAAVVEPIEFKRKLVPLFEATVILPLPNVACRPAACNCVSAAKAVLRAAATEAPERDAPTVGELEVAKPRAVFAVPEST